MESWIKLHRRSKDHWLYNENRPHTRREAWEDMLLLCNHKDNKILVEGELIECKRGQSVMSLSSWAKEFKWSVKMVRTFFELLRNDSMIGTEGLRKTTRVTILNYDIYQYSGQAEGTETGIERASRGQAEGNKQEYKNDKNIEKKDTNVSKEKTWRTDFETYLAELRTVYKSLLADKSWIAEMEKFNPGVDIKLTLEKACKTFWAVDAGWKHKRKTRSVIIDWKQTLTNSLSLKSNRVYKQKDETRNESRKPANWI